MAQTTISFKLLLLLSLSYSSTLAIKCYVCNSATQPNCDRSPPPSEYLLECSKDTLEILNDYHRQRKLEDAAAQVAEKKTDDGKPVNPGQASGPAATAPKDQERRPALDANDKDLTLNRTSRGAENSTTADGKPPVLAANPMKLPKEATFCRKTSYHIPKQDNGLNSTMPKSVRIIRSCGWIPEERVDEGQPMKTGCKWIGTEGVQMDQCVCTGDGCNSGNFLNSLKAQTLVLITFVSAGYFYVL